MTSTTGQTGGDQTVATTDASTGDTGTPVMVTVTPEENQVILDCIMDHPFCQFDEKSFLSLLQYSLSLSLQDKKRVLDAIPTLSQDQMDALIKVFLDEREEFKLLIDKERTTILELAARQSQHWLDLIHMYQRENEKKAALNQDKKKEEDLLQSLQDDTQDA